MPATAPSGVRTHGCIGPACCVWVATCVALTTHVTLIVCVSQRASFIAVGYHGLLSDPNTTIKSHSSISQFTTTASLPRFVITGHHRNTTAPAHAARVHLPQFAAAVGCLVLLPVRCHGWLTLFSAKSLPQFTAAIRCHVSLPLVYHHSSLPRWLPLCCSLHVCR